MKGPCPLCGWPEADVVSGQRSAEWMCLWCGPIRVDRAAGLGALSNEQRRLLRGLTVERHVRRESPLVINDATIEMLDKLGPADPVEQADRFLLNLAHKSSETGVPTALTSQWSGGLAFADAIDGFIAWLDFLQEEGLIQYHGRRSSNMNDLGFRLTLAGWRRVRDLKRAGPLASSGFVAMPFRAEYDDLWDRAILPAFDRTGWAAIRADKVHHNERIDDWILNQIRASKFTLVDTSGSNPGACFEAGYSLGVGRPVIWLAREEELSRPLHLDIRQYNHIAWKSGKEEAIVEKVAERILATVGPGRIARAPGSDRSASHPAPNQRN